MAFLIKVCWVFVKGLLCILWDEHVLSVLKSIYIVDVWWFTYGEPFLYFWDEDNLGGHFLWCVEFSFQVFDWKCLYPSSLEITLFLHWCQRSVEYINEGHFHVSFIIQLISLLTHYWKFVLLNTALNIPVLVSFFIKLYNHFVNSYKIT